MLREDYPLSLKVKDVSVILGIGIHQAYDLVRSGEFPSKKVGSTIRIPRDPFFHWFEGTQSHKSA